MQKLLTQVKMNIYHSVGTRITSNNRTNTYSYLNNIRSKTFLKFSDKQKEPFISTLEVAEPASSWSSSAYNALWNIKDAVSNIIHSETDNKRTRVSSADSSDGFEMIDKNDLD